jgi:hypothetical protein
MPKISPVLKECRPTKVDEIRHVAAFHDIDPKWGRGQVTISLEAGSAIHASYTIVAHSINFFPVLSVL